MAQMIGFVGENNARRAVIPAGEYWHMWPDAVCQLAYCRPGEATPYLVAVERVGDDVVWTASDTDVQIPGNGWAQLIFSVPERGIIGKSRLLPVSIGRSLGTPGEVPEGMRIYADEIAESASRAEIAQEAAEAALQKLIDGIESGDFKGDKGDKGDPGERGEPGQRGEKGDPGSDATVTKDAINAALGVDVVESIENTERELDRKQDTLTAGGGIRIEGNVISATGGSGIDVQINGTSVVQDGVANVPIGQDTLGVVKSSLSARYGIQVNNTGDLIIPIPTAAHIRARTDNPRRVLITAVINDVVTAALTDANHIELSAEQQSVAQQVLGIYSA